MVERTFADKLDLLIAFRALELDVWARNLIQMEVESAQWPTTKTIHYTFVRTDEVLSPPPPQRMLEYGITDARIRNGL